MKSFTVLFMVHLQFEFTHQNSNVKDTCTQWRLAPDHCYFKIIGDDDVMNIIRQDFKTFNWELTFYQAADGPLKNNDIDGRY